MILKELRAQAKIPDPPLAGTKLETYPNPARLRTQKQNLPLAITKSKLATFQPDSVPRYRKLTPK